MLYQITDGTVSLSGETVLSHIDFELKGKEKIAIVGPNGCGKSTLLQLIAGKLRLDRDDKSGGGIKSARRLTIGYLPQQVFDNLGAAQSEGESLSAAQNEDEGLTTMQLKYANIIVDSSTSDCVKVSENVPSSLPTVEDLIMSSCPCDNIWDQDRFQYEQEYDRMFTAFGFSKEDKTKKISEFSGGQQVRIALIARLLERPDILLLDEPTNHLDLQMTEWLENWIRSYDKAVIMVSHDRYFLDETAEVVYEISRKKLHRYVGNYSAYVAQKQKKAVTLKKEWERQQEEIKKLEELIKRFKNKPRKAAFARSRQKLLERIDVMEKPEDMVIRPDFGSLTPDNPGGRRVLETEHLTIGYEKEKPLRELNLQLRRGQKIGIIGPNGIGKTTFLKTIAGEIPALEGKIAFGQNIESAYYDQQVSLENENLTVLQHFQKAFPLLTEKEVRTTLGRWGLRGKEAGRPVKTLSGGERSKLRFAELFKACPNFLILDEPVNHLDMSAREVLESALKAYLGTVLFVSHDRYFTDQVASGLLIFERDQAQAVYYPFGYSHYAKHYHQTRTHLQAANMAMIEDFRKVPEKERGMLREISTESAYVDWQYGLITEEMEPVICKIKALEEDLCALRDTLNHAEWQQAMSLWKMNESDAEIRKYELQSDVELRKHERQSDVEIRKYELQNEAELRKHERQSDAELRKHERQSDAELRTHELQSEAELLFYEPSKKIEELPHIMDRTSEKIKLLSEAIAQKAQLLSALYDKYTEFCIRLDDVQYVKEEEEACNP